MAKRTAYEVQKTHVDAELDPMTADERRVVHNALSRIRNISTESTGEGKKRHIVIKYVASKKVEDVNDSNEEVSE